jgi:hypothetical protein
VAVLRLSVNLNYNQNSYLKKKLAGNFWSGKPAARKKNILSRLACISDGCK